MIPFYLSPLQDLVSVDLFDAGVSKQYEVIPRGGFDWPRFRRQSCGVCFQMLLDFRQREYNVPLEIGFLKLGPALNSLLAIF